MGSWHDLNFVGTSSYHSMGLADYLQIAGQLESTMSELINSDGKSPLVQLLVDSEDSEHLNPEMEAVCVSANVPALHNVYHFKCTTVPYSAALEVVHVCHSCAKLTCHMQRYLSL